MNHFTQIEAFNNIIDLQRHGLSMAQVLGKLACRPENAKMFPLHSIGIGQVRRELRTCTCLSPETVIVSSNLERARQSAGLAQEESGAKEIIVCPELRERGVGDLELGDELDFVVRIMPEDVKDPAHRILNVESLLELQDRATAKIVEIDGMFEGAHILIETHREVIQTILASALGIPINLHNSHFAIRNGEIRRLQLNGHTSR